MSAQDTQAPEHSEKTGPACTVGGLSVGSLVQPLGCQGGFTSTTPHSTGVLTPGDPIH